MTADEFNEKYSKYLEPGHYGMAIEDERAINYLDGEFEKEIENNPEFSYAQVKLKFFTARIYANSKKTHEWERAIDEIIAGSHS